MRDDKLEIPFPNCWDILGGHFEQGENSVDALKREINEEIGLEIENPLFVNKFIDDLGEEIYVFKAKIFKKLDELNLTEGQKLGYFSFEELLKLKMVEALKKFIAENKKAIFD